MDRFLHAEENKLLFSSGAIGQKNLLNDKIFKFKTFKLYMMKGRN